MPVLINDNPPVPLTTPLTATIALVDELAPFVRINDPVLLLTIVPAWVKPPLPVDPKITVPAPLIIVFTELVLPLLARDVPKITVVLEAAALVKVTVDPEPPVMPKASKFHADPVILRLALLAMLMAFVPVAVASTPVKVLVIVLDQVYPVVDQLTPATVNEPVSLTNPAVPLKL